VRFRALSSASEHVEGSLVRFANLLRYIFLLLFTLVFLEKVAAILYADGQSADQIFRVSKGDAQLMFTEAGFSPLVFEPTPRLCIGC
jgi:hypothetical protein